MLFRSDYDATSTFIVKCYGTYRPYFNDGGDKAKLIGLQIGATAHTSMRYAFYGCSALVTMVGYANTSAVTSMYAMFGGCTAFNQALPASFDTSACTSMSNMFNGCTAFKQSLAAFNIAAVTTITDMLTNCNINDTGTTTNYDNTLIAWAAQDLVDSKTLTATNCKYGGDAGSGGQQARTAIATDDLWTFVDGGHI